MPLSRPLTAAALFFALASVQVVQAATPPAWRLPWGTAPGQVGRSAPEGHHGEQSRRPPQSFAFDHSGALIVSDTFNKRVLRVPRSAASTGATSSVGAGASGAGTGAESTEVATGAAGALQFPGDVAVHTDGRLLVADRVRFQLVELGPTPRAYGQRGTAPLELLDLGRVAWGPNKTTAVGDELGHHIVLFDDGRAVRSVPYDEYGFSFDPRGRLVQPRFATLTGFILSRDDEAGRPLPALPFDVGTPLAIELLEVAEDGTALLLVPTNGATDGRRDLLRMEPGGRAHVLWTGTSLEAARTVARGPENRLYRASEEPDAYVVRRLETPAPATPTTTAPLQTLREVFRVPAARLGQPVGLIASAANVWLVGATGTWARAGKSGPSGGRFSPAPVVVGPPPLSSANPSATTTSSRSQPAASPSDASSSPAPLAASSVPAADSTTAGPAWPQTDGMLGSAFTGPDGGIWLADARQPLMHAYDPNGKPLRQIRLAGWAHAPDFVTAAGGQVLAHDRASARWIRHDAHGAALTRFADVAAGALDERTELICVQDTDEPFGKVLMQYDCNGNFFKALTTFKESTRPTGARFIGNAPGGDLLIGYWLGARAVIRRIAPDGTLRATCSFELPAGARTALWSWTISPDGDVLIATREASDYVVHAVSPAR